MTKYEAARNAIPLWIAQLKAGIHSDLDDQNLISLLEALSDTTAHDEQVIRTHAETVMATLREAMQDAIAEAEVRGYKRQIDERLAAALVQASYKPPVPGLMGDMLS